VARDGRISNQDVSGFMTGQAKIKWAAAGLNLEQEGVKVVGETKREAKVTTVLLAAPQPNATVLACVDASALKLVRADTGVPVSMKPQAPRYVQTATVELHDGRWKITDISTERERAC
jgi:hypothetical protein